MSPASESPANVYLLFGEDEFLVEVTLRKLLGKLRKSVGEDFVVEMLDSDEGSVDEVLAEIVSPSLFAANKATVLKHLRFSKQRKLLSEIEKCVAEGLVPGQVLVLVTSSVDKRLKLVKAINKAGGLIEVPEFKPEDVLRFIVDGFKDRGKKPGPRVAEILMDLKDDLRAIDSEIEKVCIYVGDAEAVTAADIENLVGRSKTEEIFNLTKAVMMRNASEALGRVADLLDRGESAMGILYSISRQVRYLIQVRLFVEGGRSGWDESMQMGSFKNTVMPRFRQWVEDAGISPQDTVAYRHPYGVFMRFRESSGFRVADLIDFLDLLLAANLELVSTSVPPRIVLEKLISGLGVETCRAA